MTIHCPTPGLTFETAVPTLTIERGSPLRFRLLSARLSELFRINDELDAAIRAAAVKPADMIVSDIPPDGFYGFTPGVGWTHTPFADPPAVVDDSPAALIARLTAGDAGENS